MSELTVNPIISNLVNVATPQVLYLADGLAIFPCVGNPETVINADIGSIAIDVGTGDIYRKTTAYTFASGWIKLSTLLSGNPIAITNAILTTAGTVSSGDTILHSYTIPANTWDIDGRTLIWLQAGLFANNAASKQLYSEVAGKTPRIDDTGGPNVITNKFWAKVVWLTRASSTTLRGGSICHISQTATAGVIDSYSVTVNSMDFTVANTVRSRGQGAATNDITQDISVFLLG